MCQYTSIRAEVKELHDHTCQHCFEQFHPSKLQVHHIIPQREGRDDSFENLIPFCADCHTEVEAKLIPTNKYGRVIYNCKEIRERNKLELLFPRLEEKILTLAA